MPTNKQSRSRPLSHGPGGPAATEKTLSVHPTDFGHAKIFLMGGLNYVSSRYIAKAFYPWHGLPRGAHSLRRPARGDGRAGGRAGRAAPRAAVLLGTPAAAVLAMAGTAFAHITVTPASSRQEDQDQP